ncbi:UDP-glucosyltransferase 29-like [Impatiens glandulifera]|uniref:UDP-glucosyltransferase 29-like n=1 Tax=Impatiens glandulifera TaxID=253017 RepID=UPI001FB0D637|nr:UDP-glucosyltransferase 29-like [Impatiens glandulifera]
MEAKDSILKIVMLPWLAHGHISPYLELAKNLAKRNCEIYICSTQVNLNSIKNKVSEINQFFNPSFNSIHLIEIQIPFHPDLPPHHHTTNGLPPHLIPTLMKAFSMVIPSFSQTLKTLNPDLVLYDVFQPWASKLAASLSIPAVEFNTTCAAMICYGYHRSENPNSTDFPYPELNPRGSYWVRKMNEMFSSPPDGNEDESSPLESHKRSCQIILTKSFLEIEEKYLDYGSTLLGKRIIPAGALVPDPGCGGDDIVDMSKNVMEWLEKKGKSSTIFVSFGSECYLSREEMEEVAYGLEESMVNFIWVLRFPKEEKRTIRFDESIPKGFLQRVGDRGLLVETWAPQARILAHENIGGFVSHCGWGSIMEAMGFGVPIIGMPMQFDQPINLKVIVEARAGMEVVRDEAGMLDRRAIARVIREVVLGDELGKQIRNGAKEIREKLKMKGGVEMDRVVEELMIVCGKNNKS